MTRLCHDTDGGATSVRSGLRPQIPFLPLDKHSSKQLDVFRTRARVPERSKYCTATCRPDAKWSAAAGRPTSPHLNRDSSPVRFGHFLYAQKTFENFSFNLRVFIKDSRAAPSARISDAAPPARLLRGTGSSWSNFCGTRHTGPAGMEPR